MAGTHPLLEARVRAALERAVSDSLGRAWAIHSFTNLDDRASHPAGILHGDNFLVFAKLSRERDGADLFRAELGGLAFLRERTEVATPTPVGEGLVVVDPEVLFVSEALSEHPPPERTLEDWRSVGSTLATIHRVKGERFGLKGLNGFLGPFPQDNSPVRSSRWADFYVERRLLPFLSIAVDSGHLPIEVARSIDPIVTRMPTLCGPEPTPTLLHGDAQQHNFISTESGAVVADVAPYFGNPELDLALIDIYHQVPEAVFSAYREFMPIDSQFGERRELWRLYCYLAAVAVEGDSAFGRRMLSCLVKAVDEYS